MFWILIAILTAAVAIVLIYPLMRAKGDVSDPAREGEVAVYRDQLAELQRERASGLIGDAEAEYARAEIGRRLLASASGKAGEEAVTLPRRHNALATFVIMLLPVTGLCLYVYMGSPAMPDMPLQARLEKPGNDMNLLVARAERHLAQNPNDGTGWDVLAPIYFKTLRLADAEMAYRNALRIQGESPERLIGLAETLIATNQGIVVEDARSALEKAEQLRAGNPRARFYLALALEQAGKMPEAQAAFKTILQDSPEGAPWIPLVQEHIKATNGEALAATQGEGGIGDLSAEDVAAVNELAPDDRQALIVGMVETLDSKLQENPDNFEGWMRLVRSYAMLNNREKAKQALVNGLKTFPAAGEQGKQLLALAQQLGVATEGVAQ